MPSMLSITIPVAIKYRPKEWTTKRTITLCLKCAVQMIINNPNEIGQMYLEGGTESLGNGLCAYCDGYLYDG